MGEHELLTPGEAAQLLTISTKTLREHVKAGEIAFIPTGRGEKRVRMGFDRKDILDFIESRRKRACPSTSTQKAPAGLSQYTFPARPFRRSFSFYCAASLLILSR